MLHTNQECIISGECVPIDSLVDNGAKIFLCNNSDIEGKWCIWGSRCGKIIKCNSAHKITDLVAKSVKNLIRRGVLGQYNTPHTETRHENQETSHNSLSKPQNTENVELLKKRKRIGRILCDKDPYCESEGCTYIHFPKPPDLVLIEGQCYPLHELIGNNGALQDHGIFCEHGGECKNVYTCNKAHLRKDFVVTVENEKYNLDELEDGFGIKRLLTTGNLRFARLCLDENKCNFGKRCSFIHRKVKEYV